MTNPADISRLLLLTFSAAGIVIIFVIGYRSKRWGFAILPLVFLSGMAAFYALRLMNGVVLTPEQIITFNNFATALDYLAIITAITLGVALLWNRG